MEPKMQPHYERMFKEGRCWRACRQCQYGRMFLKQLYSWSELNSLHPMLVWKVCDTCEFDHVEIKAIALVNDEELTMLGKAEAFEQYCVRMNVPFEKYNLSLGYTGYNTKQAPDNKDATT